MPDPEASSPPREPARKLYSAFGGELGDPWADTYPDDPTYDEGRAARAYRVRSEGVWSAAREEYVAGASAETVCERYDLGLSAFRQRARREGWRKCDAEDLAPDALAYPPEPEAAPPTGELADLAWRSAAQAIRRGRVYEARAWMKLAEALREKARNEDWAKRWAAEDAEAAAQASADAAADEDDDDNEDGGDEDEAARLHPLHSDDGVQSARWDPACGRPPTEAECAAIITDMETDLAANPGFPGAATMLRDLKALFARPTGQSP